MINWYVESLAEPGYHGDDITGRLLERAKVADFRLEEIGELDALDGVAREVNAVGGLATVIGGLTRIIVDVPEGGRMMVANPRPHLEVPELEVVEFSVPDMLSLLYMIDERCGLLMNAGQVTVDEVLDQN